MTATTEWDQAARRWTIDVPDQRPDLDVAATIRAGVDHIRNNGGGLVHLWIHGVDDATDQAAVAAGFEAHRDLWQLRCPLPAEPSPLETRAFTPADTEALIGVNNRAFSWHPEQSGMTSESLAATMREPWYEPEGFRLYEVEGELKQLVFLMTAKKITYTILFVIVEILSKKILFYQTVQRKKYYLA